MCVCVCVCVCVSVLTTATKRFNKDIVDVAVSFVKVFCQRQQLLKIQALSVLSLISVSIPPQCYHSSTYKTPVILTKVQVAGYS